MKREHTIENILILWLLAAVMAVIVLAALAMGHHSVSQTKVQMWQADSSWVNGWKINLTNK